VGCADSGDMNGAFAGIARSLCHGVKWGSSRRFGPGTSPSTKRVRRESGSMWIILLTVFVKTS
jgi:hypothetical protein